jgi:putative ABC transport system permease protein
MGDRFSRRWARIFKRDPRVEVEEELSFHIEQRVRDYIARGLDPESARAAALERLGALDGVRQECAELLSAVRRTKARRDWLLFSWLDVKLATRMLLRHHGLTVVAVFALAIGIPVGLLPLHVLDSLTRPLPVEDADEIVLVRNYDRAGSRSVLQSVHDFEQWRNELSSFAGLGAWRADLYNVNSENPQATPVRGAEIGASVFMLLRVAPLLGRPLARADEITGAPHVVVISYDLWQSRLAANPEIIGSTIRIGAVPHTVVGVMPEGFLFPFRQQLWLPFRYNALAYKRGDGPRVSVVGRLARGVSIEEANSEIAALGQRMAHDFPDTHTHLVPQVLPYTAAIAETDSAEFRMGVVVAQTLAFLLLALACGNVGILVLARSATRTREIAIRAALGAGRRRIVSQLFIESFALAAVAAGLGLLALQFFAHMTDKLVDELPFWVHLGVSLKTALLALILAIASAVIAGVVPALKATGKGVQLAIQDTLSGRSGIRFGKGYSALIIAEVAVSVFLLMIGSGLVPLAIAKPGALGIQADQYLYAALRLPRLGSTANDASDNSEERVAFAHRELLRRLSSEPGVGRPMIASAFPGLSSDRAWIQVEGVPPAPNSPAPGYHVNVAKVDVDYFDALGAPILNGRNFNTSDLRGNRSAIIVNTSFVERVLGGRNPIGRRVRYWSPEQQQPGPWEFEIVGVVARLGMNSLKPEADQGMYHVIAPGELHPVQLAVRVGNNPEQFTPRLRAIAREIDPNALVQNARTLSDVPDPERWLLTWGAYLVSFLAGVAVLLSAACLYALMSFTVAERTRECGIRAALGAPPARIVSAISTRAFFQLCSGVSIGVGVSILLFTQLDDLTGAAFRSANWQFTVTVISIFVIAVGMAACLKPTIKALRIRPMEALKG